MVHAFLFQTSCYLSVILFPFINSKNPAQNGCFIFLMVRPSFLPSDGIGQEEVHRQEDCQDVYLDKPKPVR